MSGGDDAILKPDLCIIGAGAGGLSLAAGAAQLGARVVLIEGGAMGGDCLNHGCVPSKALLAAAEAAEAARRGAVMGVAAEVTVDFAAVKDHVARAIASIAPHDSEERFTGLGVTVIRAWARFTSPREVEADGQRIRARRFVIATGSRPAIPPVPGLDAVPWLDSAALLALREAPSHLLVLGAGPVGVEMAQAHRRLGAGVTLIEAAQPLHREDPEAVAVVLAALRREGVAVHDGAPVVRLRQTQDGGIEAVLSNGVVLRGSQLLVATGRVPELDRLDLAAGGVATGARGVEVTARLRSMTNRRVYAIGDAAGGAHFSHSANAQAGVVLRQVLFGLPARAPATVPRVTFTDPELAQVGLTEAEARRSFGARATVLRSDLARNDRAVATACAGEGGFVKVMVVGGRPVGATLVGPEAGELAALWALAITGRVRLTTLAGTILPYPTLAESARAVAGAYFLPRIFANPTLRRVVRIVQRLVP